MQWLSNLSFNDYFLVLHSYIHSLWLGYGLQVEYGFYLKREYKQNEIPQPVSMRVVF